MIYTARRMSGAELYRMNVASVCVPRERVVAEAQAIGKTIAERAMAKGIKRVVFDRNGFLYHGRIRTVADAARKAGLEF